MSGDLNRERIRRLHRIVRTVQADSVTVEPRPGWPMHMGVLRSSLDGSIVWRAPIARSHVDQAFEDAFEAEAQLEAQL